MTELPKGFVFDPNFIPRSVFDVRKESIEENKEENVSVARKQPDRKILPHELFPKGKENIITLSAYNIILFNDIVCGEVVAMVDAIKRTTYYMYGIKKKVNDIHLFRRNYERRLKEILGDMQMSDSFADMCDIYTNHFEPYLNIFRIQVKQSLDNNGVKDSYAVALCVTTRVLANMSVRLYEDRLRQMKEDNALPYFFNLSYLKMDVLAKMANELECMFDIDSVECPMGQKAVDVLHNMLERADLIADAINRE